MKEIRLNKLLLYIAFSMYIFLLIWIIALKFNATWIPEIGEYFRKLPIKERVGKNIIPFYDMIKNGIYFNKDYFMNVIIYMPLGIYLTIILKNKHRTFFCITIIAVSSFLFELIQLLTGFGGCDGSDFVCNVLGGLIGMIIYHFLAKLKSVNKIVNIINAIVIIIFLPLTVHAIINTVTNLHLYKI